MIQEVHAANNDSLSTIGDTYWWYGDAYLVVGMSSRKVNGKSQDYRS